MEWYGLWLRCAYGAWWALTLHYEARRAGDHFGKTQWMHSHAAGSASAAVLAISHTFKVIVGSCMVGRRVGPHATDYVCG